MSDLHVYLLLLVSVLVEFLGPTFAVTVPCIPNSIPVSKEWQSLTDFSMDKNNCSFAGPNSTSAIPPA